MGVLKSDQHLAWCTQPWTHVHRNASICDTKCTLLTLTHKRYYFSVLTRIAQQIKI